MRITIQGEALIDFLNQQDVADAKLKEVQLDLRECVELIRSYRTKWAGEESKRRKFNLSKQLFRNIADRTRALLAECTITVHPGSITEDLWQAREPDKQRAYPWLFMPRMDPPEDAEPDDVRRVFSSEGMTLAASPSWGDYVLSFIAFLCDDSKGIDRIMRCRWCGKFASGRPNQKYCGDKCRSTHHNRMRDPEANRAAVQRHREECREEERRIESKLKRLAETGEDAGA